MRSAVLTTNVYKLKQSRLKMVLEAVERRLTDDDRTEKVTLGSALWIEHLLPQTWRGTAAWELPSGLADPTQAGYERDHMLHTMGNLTLTTSKLDIELSNRPWNEKVGMIGAHSALALNRAILQRYPDRWDEETIRERSTSSRSGRRPSGCSASTPDLSAPVAGRGDLTISVVREVLRAHPGLNKRQLLAALRAQGIVVAVP
jgi:hypothetical protein